MTSLTLEHIESEHARVGELIAQFKKQSLSTEYTVERAVIPLHAGERLAGPIFKEDGTLDYYLIKLPGDGGDLEYPDAVSYVVGRGAKLPDRREARLLMANLHGEFDQVAHWLEETYESNSACAWSQNFSYGDQYCYHKSAALRAVAVRRFIPSVI